MNCASCPASYCYWICNSDLVRLSWKLQSQCSATPWTIDHERMHATSRTLWRIRSQLLFCFNLALYNFGSCWHSQCYPLSPPGCMCAQSASKTAEFTAKKKGKHTSLCPAPYERLENNHFVSLAAASPVLSVSPGDIKTIHTLRLKYGKVLSFDRHLRSETQDHWKERSLFRTNACTKHETSEQIHCKQYFQHVRRKFRKATAKDHSSLPTTKCKQKPLHDWGLRSNESVESPEDRSHMALSSWPFVDNNASLNQIRNFSC